MEMVITLLILVGAAVVFLANVFRQAKEDREQAERRSNLPPRRRDSSTERFLEEINRRRQQAGGRAKSPPPVRPATLTPAPTPTPRREPTVRKVIPKAEKPRQDRPASRRVSAQEVAGTLLEVVAADKPSMPIPAVPELPRLPGSPGMERRTLATQVAARPISPVLQHLLPFLKSRQTLRAGFVLHQILGPPRSRRRRSSFPA